MTTEKPRPPRTHGAPPITLSEHEQADAERRQQIALFRYGVIADLIHLEPGHRGLYALLRDKAAREWDIPGTLRRRVEAETIRGWLRDYRRGGFDALLPKARKDRGSARAIPQCVADVLCETKDQHPDFSVALVIEHVSRFARIPDDVVLAPSTVHRLLARAGLMQKKPGEPTSNDRRRFSFDQAGELWLATMSSTVLRPFARRPRVSSAKPRPGLGRCSSTA